MAKGHRPLGADQPALTPGTPPAKGAIALHDRRHAPPVEAISTRLIWTTPEIIAELSTYVELKAAT